MKLVDTDVGAVNFPNAQIYGEEPRKADDYVWKSFHTEVSFVTMSNHIHKASCFLLFRD